MMALNEDQLAVTIQVLTTVTFLLIIVYHYVVSNTKHDKME